MDEGRPKEYCAKTSTILVLLTMRYTRRCRLLPSASVTYSAFWGGDREEKMPGGSCQSPAGLRPTRTAVLRSLLGADPTLPHDSLHTIGAPAARLGECRQQAPTCRAALSPLTKARPSKGCSFFLPHSIAFDLGYLDRLQIRQDCADIGNVEHEFRHIRMACIEALGKSFRERVDWITLPQCTKWRRRRMRTVTGPCDGMTSRAVTVQQQFAAVLQFCTILRQRDP